MHTSVIGLQGSGKSTLMDALVGQASGQSASRGGLVTVKVPDERIDRLSKIFNPKKTIHAEIRMQEIPWTVKDGGDRRGEAEKYVKTLAGAEVLIHIVRGFENPYLSDDPDPVRDLAAMDQEMIFADLLTCENYFERSKKKKPDPQQHAVLEKAHGILENEQFLYMAEFTEDERRHLAGFNFSTLIRQLVIVNVSEDGGKGQLKSTDQRPVLELPLNLAREVAELPADEQAEFLADMGVTEPLVNQVTREAYALMSFISFFTVGEDEVRAWTITAGMPAQRAAGKIHSDLERGFIRAEVVDYETFMKQGTLKACKETGTLRVEGKTYEVKDGDIINVRFNV